MIRDSFIKILTLLLTISYAIILFSCSSEEIRTPPVTESENLNTLLNAAPISWIDLDNAEVDTLVIPENSIFEERLFVDESLYVRLPIQMKAFQDHLITLEFSSGNVVALSKEGEPVQTIGRSGRGPGEFERPIAVMADSENLYIYDDGLRRMSVFNSDLLLLDTFDFKDAVYSENKMKMNDRYLVYQNSNASGFHAPDPESFLLTVREIENLDTVYFEALPRIVPSGNHPGAYNNLGLSINSKNKILAAFPGVPYLYLYRDFEHARTIVLESVYYDTTGNPSLRPYPPVDNTGVGVSNILSNIYLLENSDILIASFGLFHHLKSNSNGEYDHHRSYYLKREDTGEQIMIFRDIDSFPDDPFRFFALGWGFIFELTLPD
ncbi:hypothetical protein DYD21_03850 [Rhodohalobacter sp. SW132]|uniref:6-bladed beta-propeller n=1 Tax=Rhodohalobacter sp. SW132 TaxID=2293433 RepID=UPI000E2586E6|nr:6-bladed beta-propeller [Rhodohalobacter sp. SW132]REL39100.1 hypothetical protein DYD21_03850 [Rhodohalobacter sp. SW132]